MGRQSPAQTSILAGEILVSRYDPAERYEHAERSEQAERLKPAGQDSGS